MRYCWNCGKQLQKENDKFCAECGTNLLSLFSNTTTEAFSGDKNLKHFHDARDKLLTTYSSNASQTINMVLAIGVILFAEGQVFDAHPNTVVVFALIFSTAVAAVVLFIGSTYWGSLAHQASEGLPDDVLKAKDATEALNELYKKRIGRKRKFAALASYPLAAIFGGITFILVSASPTTFQFLLLQPWPAEIIVAVLTLLAVWYVIGHKKDYT